MKLGKCENPIIIDGTQRVVYDSGELTEAVTSLTISGLDGDNDEEYELIVRSVDNDNGGDIVLTFNTDTGTNYGYQTLRGANTDKSAFHGTGAGFYIGETSNNAYICLSNTKIKAKSGQVRTGITNYTHDITGTTVTGVVLRGSSWNNTADNITQMVISASANGLGIGSRIILLKKVTETSGLKTGNLAVQGKVYGVWQEIYNTTLTEAATSVTISNLTGNSDVLYRLRVRTISGNGDVYTYLRFNNDTGSNYGHQRLIGVDTTVAAGRNTSQDLLYTLGEANATGYSSKGESLIYAKSGYVRMAITECTGGITGTTVTNLFLCGSSWNNTSDEITSLVVFASQANGLGIGTNIVLERLNL